MVVKINYYQWNYKNKINGNEWNKIWSNLTNNINTQNEIIL